MNATALERILWFGGALAGAVAIRVWWGQPAAATAAVRLSMAAARLPATFDADSLAAAADDAVGQDLFRPDRAPGQVTQAPALAASSGPTPPRPRFVVRGIVGGPPWDVIIDGLPGRPAGTVVRDGETLAGFSIRVIARDTVQVRGADTLWMLVLARK